MFGLRAVETNEELLDVSKNRTMTAAGASTEFLCRRLLVSEKRMAKIKKPYLVIE